MKNKQLHRFCMNIPEYAWKQIIEIDKESNTTTLTGTILTILEKGLNYYRKKKRASSLDQEAPNAEPLNSTVEQEEYIKKQQEIAKTRWVD